MRRKRAGGKLLISVVIPCLNEEESIGRCLREAQEGTDRLLKSPRIPREKNGEIIVVDNGSTDGSVKEVEQYKPKSKKNGIEIKIFNERLRGYGAALLRGFKEARGQTIIMGDGDGSYDFREISKLVRPIIDGGHDLVVGSRLLGRIEKGAMPTLHRRLGTPVLTSLANRLFGLSLTDSQSGLRAIKADAYRKLGMRMEGMEFASEMLARAGRAGLAITEVPIAYRKRKGASKLLPVKDAWRHLRFLLLFSPEIFFSYPGIVLTALGTVGFILTAPAPFRLGQRELDVHTLSVSGMALLLGIQLVSLGIFSRVYGKYSLGLTQKDLTDFIIERFQLEQGLRAGSCLFVIGLLILGWVTGSWAIAGFPALAEIRPVIVGTIVMLLGAQVFFGSFFLSFLRGEGK